MHVFCDTCFLIHLVELYKELKIDIISILKNYKIALTPSLIEEFMHYNIFEYLPQQYFSNILISESEHKKFEREFPYLNYLDKADQSILISADLYKNSLLLTDDGALLLEATARNLKVYKLPQFMLYLANNNMISKNTVSKCLKYWEIVGRYSLKDLKYWKNILQKIE